MAEKLKLDLSLVSPDVPDERDACVGPLTVLLQAEGLKKMHVIRDDGRTHLCLHYDPQRFTNRFERVFVPVVLAGERWPCCVFRSPLEPECRGRTRKSERDGGGR